MTRMFSKGSEWRRWDLQVQTIIDDGYVELSTYSDALKAAKPVEWKAYIDKVGSEENAIKYDSKTYFSSDANDDEKMRVTNYARNFVSFLESFHSDEVCIAITDHNYDHPSLLDALIRYSADTRVSILAGVELNIQGVHLLAIFGEKLFGKQSYSESIKTFLSKLDIDQKKVNGVLAVSNKSYTDVLDLIHDNGGIAIYPHCNSSNGLFQERGKTDRTHLADQFNYQEFNILQGRNKASGESLGAYVSSKADTLTSPWCYTTASDARCLKDILSADESGNYTWIKADPTFEGLKQIMFEPSRVSIQPGIPEDKSGYQVIDKIQINNELILNSEIPINSNMTSIIGGRSTGKSVLLTAIAHRLKTEIPITFPQKPDYMAFVDSVASSITVTWKDGEINNDREIEFFRQGYMYELATDAERLSKLVQDILRIKGKDSHLNAYEAKKAEIRKAISAHINDLFQVLTEIQRRQILLLEKGDRKGVEEEIAKLNRKLMELDKLQLSEDERKIYEEHRGIIEHSNGVKNELLRDIQKLERLKEISPIKLDFDYEFATLSNNSKGDVTSLFNRLKQEADKSWSDGIENAISKITHRIASEDKNITASQIDSVYIKASEAYKNSAQLNELQDRIKEQKANLSQIEVLSRDVKEFLDYKTSLRTKILELHSQYFSVTQELIPNLSDGKDGLDIIAMPLFYEAHYGSVLENSLNMQSASSKQIVDFRELDNTQFIVHIAHVLDLLINNQLTLKGSYTPQSLALTLLAESYYGLSYDLVYEGDNFNHMSDGKKAFVVLKLLLDFSEKNCPILIDQPEDDLDNRAIYIDLVQYLKKKKIKRQIIVATHNPNIVVGSDSEMVIVANQHGVKSENAHAKKFAYKTGSLEYSSPIDSTKPIILDSQGIREHVCVILEGGDAAFKLREKKYAISI